MSETEFQSAFSVMPGVMALLGTDDPQFIVMACTNDFAALGNSTPNQLIGRPLLEPFPENQEMPGRPHLMLLESLRAVIATGLPHELPVQRFDIGTPRDGYCKRYWRISNRPYFSPEGKLAGIIHAAQDITLEVLEGRREKQIRGFGQAFDLFINAPQAIGIVSGKDLVIGLANRTMLRLLRAGDDIVGMPLLDALAGRETYGLAPILRQVLESGKTFEDKQAPIQTTEGNPETKYFHIRCQPFFEPGHKEASGVLIYAHNVSDKVQAIRRLREKQQRYRTLIEEAPIATALYTGPNLVIQYINGLMLGYWGKDKSVQGKEFREALPEMANQQFPDELEQVFLTGKDFVGHEQEAYLMIDGKPKKSYFNYAFKALRDQDGKVYGIHHTAIDVTQQVTNRRDLEASERKFRNLSHSLEETIQERTFLVSQLNETFRHAERAGKFGSFRYNLRSGELSYSETYTGFWAPNRTVSNLRWKNSWNLFIPMIANMLKTKPRITFSGADPGTVIFASSGTAER